MLASSKWSAIEFGIRLQPLRDLGREDVEQERLDARLRGVPSSRERHEQQHRDERDHDDVEDVEGPDEGVGQVGAVRPDDLGERRARAAIVATKAANHGQARPGRSKATAPSGASSDHRITELDSSRPPSMTIPSAGATRIRSSCAVRRNAKFRVRAKTTRLIADPVT